MDNAQKTVPTNDHNHHENASKNDVKQISGNDTNNFSEMNECGHYFQRQYTPPHHPIWSFLPWKVGKSSTCLGLLGALLKHGLSSSELAYIKPATQCEKPQLVTEWCEKRGVACRGIGPVVFYKARLWSMTEWHHFLTGFSTIMYLPLKSSFWCLSVRFDNTLLWCCTRPFRRRIPHSRHN